MERAFPKGCICQVQGLGMWRRPEQGRQVHQTPPTRRIKLECSATSRRKLINQTKVNARGLVKVMLTFGGQGGEKETEEE